MLKLPLFIPRLPAPASHALVGYPPLPTCLPKLLGTHAGPQREDDDNVNCDQPAIDISLKHIESKTYIQIVYD